MNLIDRFVVRHELAKQRRWRDNAFEDWDKQWSNAEKSDLARRLAARLRSIDELEERLRRNP